TCALPIYERNFAFRGTRNYAHWPGHDLLRRRLRFEGWTGLVAGQARGHSRPALDQVLVCLSQQDYGTSVGNDRDAREDLFVYRRSAATRISHSPEAYEAGRRRGLIPAIDREDAEDDS